MGSSSSRRERERLVLLRGCNGLNRARDPVPSGQQLQFRAIWALNSPVLGTHSSTIVRSKFRLQRFTRCFAAVHHLGQSERSIEPHSAARTIPSADLSAPQPFPRFSMDLSLPEPGQIVIVRQRPFVVTGIHASTLPVPGSLNQLGFSGWARRACGTNTNR